MFSTHLFYKEGTRPSMAYPFCERENADVGASNGQCGSHLVDVNLFTVTCPYCHWEKLKDIHATTPELLSDFLTSGCFIHWGIHPVFSVDGRIRFLRWDAACGEVKVHPEVCLATRHQNEVTCEGCLDTLVKT